jgi:hypothetical protein
MLHLWGSNRGRMCDGISRRNFLRIGACGAGLTLAEMLRSRARAGAGRASSEKSVIMIYLTGGPPHLDMYDLKPDAPVEYRGKFKPIQTNVPGVDVCQLFPLQAKMWDKLAVIRSVVAGNGDHRDWETHTGYDRPGHPSFGSIISKIRGVGPAGTPPFVNLRGDGGGTSPTYLGVAHRPFQPSGPGVENLSLAPELTAERVKERRSLLAGFDDLRRDVDASGAMKGMDAFTRRAFDMVTSGNVRHALDVSKESAQTRQRYKGIEKVLLARRLVEAGVGAVTLDIGNWDTHLKNFEYCDEWLPIVDRAIANLIQDLHERGLDQDVVTILWGEFGRTPKINNNQGGRDHWPAVMSALIAGGGLKMGQAVGSTTARAEQPKDRPYRVSQVLSTIYRTVGIDPSQTLPDGSGRPVYVLDDREPVTEL